MQDIKATWQKVWHFLWKEDSVASWIVSLVLAFIIVKFIFFPLLSLVFATPLPLVVVESSSMHHSGFLGNTFGTHSYFETWWTKSSNWYLDHNINEDKFLTFPLHNGMEIGDIILIKGSKDYDVGEIIVFQANQAHPIIHRIISKTDVDGTTYYSTKGDNNADQLSIEKKITKEQILGKALLRVPKIGWIKLWFAKLLGLF